MRKILVAVLASLLSITAGAQWPNWVQQSATGGGGSFAGSTLCTNQFMRQVDGAGVTTCASVSNADLAGSIAASKLVGTDIATLGTITAGTWNSTVIGILYGGSGQTTANAALNAFLPSQTGKTGRSLVTDGTNTSWGPSSVISDQTSTTLPLDHTYNGLMVRYTGTATGAWTIPSGVTLTADFAMATANTSDFDLVITPASGTIAYGTVSAATLTIPPRSSASIWSDGANLFANYVHSSELATPSLHRSYASVEKTIGSTGTTANLLARLDTSGQVVTIATSDTKALGVAISTGASTAVTEVATQGVVNCVADNTTIVGNLIITGTTTAGRCKDSGQTSATAISNATQIIGRALTAVSAASNVSIQLSGPDQFGTQVASGSGLVETQSGVSQNQCSAAYASLPAASSNNGRICIATDLNTAGGAMVRSDNVDWRPLNGVVNIYSGGIPIGIPPSGSVANNGVTTLGTFPAGSLSFGATSGAGVTLTGTGTAFASTDVGRVVVVDGGKLATITAWTSTTVVTVTISGGTLSTTAFANAAWQFTWPFYTTYTQGLYLYFAANTICTSGQASAGFYWAVPTASPGGTVKFTLNNNTWTGNGPPTAPTSPTAFVCTGPGAYTGVTSLQQAVQFPLPANAMTADGSIEIDSTFSVPNTSTSKSWRFRGGSTNLIQDNVSSALATEANRRATVRNLGSRVSQIGTYFTNDPGSGSATFSPYSAVDFTTSQTLNIQLQTGTSTDYTILENAYWTLRE